MTFIPHFFFYDYIYISYDERLSGKSIVNCLYGLKDAKNKMKQINVVLSNLYLKAQSVRIYHMNNEESLVLAL